jgi:hypothetical protein
VTAVPALRSPVPVEIVALIAAVAIGGTAAGFMAATPLLLVASPLVAIGLAAAAVWGMPLSVRMLAQLPDSQARDLLQDLLRRAEIVSSRAKVEPLVSVACEAARQLYVLEAHLDDERCRRSKELLVQRLQDATAALSRWEASAAWQIEGEMSKLTAELTEELRRQHDAARDVEALLA